MHLPHSAEDREPAVSEHTEGGSQMEGDRGRIHTHTLYSICLRTLYSIRMYSICILKFAIRIKLVVAAVFAYPYIHLNYAL